MLNVIFSILIIPFLPVFMYGSLKTTASQIGSVPTSATSEVLGAESQKTGDGSLCSNDGSQGFQTYNLFPLNQAPATTFIPERRADYADIMIWAGSSVAIDADSGTLLEYSDGRKEVQIASLTKIMTATLILENVKNLDDVVTITPEALNVDGTKVGCPTSVFCNDQRLVIGEKITVKDLLTAMLLDSANDAATALGIYVGGSKQGFVDMMNVKAKSLGLQDTHFCTPSGLEIDGHENECYSSAYDIGRIAAYSLKYSWLWNVMSTKEATAVSTDGRYVHHLQNTDEILGEVPDCIGGKTGFTPLAGMSLLLATTDPTRQHRVVTVILNDRTVWADMQKLVSWVFNNYEWR